MQLSHPDPRAHRAHRIWEQGCALARQGRWEGAETRFKKALALAPREPVYRLNLARAQMKQDDWAGTADSALQVLVDDPDNALAAALAVRALMRLRRHAEAVEVMQAFPADAPRDEGFHVLLGEALEGAGKPREAIDAYMDALALRVDHTNAHLRMGYCFEKLDMKEEAAQCMRTAHVLGVGDAGLNVLGLLSFREREVCRWQDRDADEATLREQIDALPADSDIAVATFPMLSLWDEPALQLKAARSAARHVSRGMRSMAPRLMPPLQGRRLRVGYLSNDFFHHATSILMAGMLEAHDRDRFEVTLYSHSEHDGSALAQRMRCASEHFVDVGKIDDHTVAKRIRDDGIDVLVDLKGFTRGTRFSLLAFRPAPVQASFLGYPGTTGADWIDYVVGDPVVTPLSDAAHFAERIAQMPLCYQPNDSHRPLPAAATRDEAGLPPEAFVFCAFNQPYKITPQALDAWCEILRRTPGSLLWLLEWNGQARKNLDPEIAARGIDAARIVWAPPRQYARHLARFRQADLFLDSWPYNAHTTASDALWAGVPVLTLQGRSFAARVAASLNRAVGLDDLVCQDVGRYVDRAVQLFEDRQALAAHRAQVEAQRRGPLFDSWRFVQDWEALLMRMAERAAAGLPPAHLGA